jgi:hypothetical protein
MKGKVGEVRIKDRMQERRSHQCGSNGFNGMSGYL